MFHSSLIQLRGRLACLLFTGFAVASLTPAHGQSPGKQDNGPLLRIICVASLSDGQEIILASRDEKGAWREHGTTELRSPFISQWLPAKTGELYLTLRNSKELISICRFTYPEDARRALLVLLPEADKKGYRADVINPAKMKFTKGSTLLVNYSSTQGTVMLGTRRASVKPGERVTVRPVPEANGMFRLLIAYTGKTNELVPCDDRYIPYDDESRELLMLFPDPVFGLRAFSLAEFGPFE